MGVKDSVKEFVKPKLSKIIVFLILFALLSVVMPGLSFQTGGSRSCPGYSIGAPVVFFGECTNFLTKNTVRNFNVIWLLVDVLFWYLISCTLIVLYSLIKNKIHN